MYSVVCLCVYHCVAGAVTPVKRMNRSRSRSECRLGRPIEPGIRWEPRSPNALLGTCLGTACFLNIFFRKHAADSGAFGGRMLVTGFVPGVLYTAAVADCCSTGVQGFRGRPRQCPPVHSPAQRSVDTLVCIQRDQSSERSEASRIHTTVIAATDRQHRPHLLHLLHHLRHPRRPGTCART